MPVATTLLVVVAVGHLLGYLPATLRHTYDSSWPDHARFHAFQSLLLVAGWDVAVVLLALGPVQRHEGWALWVLVVYLVFVQLGYFVSMAAVPSGRPPGLVFHLLYLAAMLMFAVGLAVAWRAPHGN
jgi:uncharacterized membrane protein